MGKLNSTEIIDALTDLFILRGVPAYIRSHNGPEFIAEAVRDWIKGPHKWGRSHHSASRDDLRPKERALVLRRESQNMLQSNVRDLCWSFYS